MFAHLFLLRPSAQSEIVACDGKELTNFKICLSIVLGFQHVPPLPGSCNFKNKTNHFLAALCLLGCVKEPVSVGDGLKVLHLGLGQGCRGRFHLAFRSFPLWHGAVKNIPP